MRILNWFVTNKYMVKLSHALCRAWNVAALRTPRAKRRRERSRAVLEAYAGEGRINGQGRDPVARLPYGRFTMDYNGCEVIAAYNALLTLGRPLPLGGVAGWFERFGLFLGGAWGTHVLAIPRFFAANGVPARTLYASAVRDAGEYDAAFARAPAAVFSFWNNAKRLRDGVHTVALSHGKDGRLVIDNLYGLDRGPNTAYHTIEEMIDRTGILPLLLITIEGKD